jgi:hypothetical protein
MVVNRAMHSMFDLSAEVGVIDLDCVCQGDALRRVLGV